MRHLTFDETLERSVLNEVAAVSHAVEGCRAIFLQITPGPE